MTKQNYDSEFCGNVPIHLVNSVQPYGVLVIIDRKSGKIIQVSENADKVFGTSPQELINKSLDSFIGKEAVTAFSEFAQQSQSRLPTTWKINGKNFLSIVHSRENYYLAEIEIESIDVQLQESFVKVFQDTRVSLSSIESGKTILEVCQKAAEELKKISGFDKVMIYSFDSEWNGFVEAEVMEEGMESYLGFTFPASDIPKQARELYLKNPYRFIPDRAFTPVKLFPVINPSTGAFIDLSECNLRSVVAVHLEYLKNMGVTSSMSTRILKDDKLWGLIACHHRTAKTPSYQMCSVFELISNVLSARITSLLNSESHAVDSKISERYTKLVEDVYKHDSIEQAFLASPGITELFNASGAAIVHGERISTTGITPDKSSLEDLVLWLHTRQLTNIFHTDSLASQHDIAKDYKDDASGLLVLPIDPQEDEYVMVFRPEVLKVINWGGDPAERIRFEENEKNYHPRNSFKQWQQKVNGHSKDWRVEELQIAEKLRSFIFEYRSLHPSFRK